MKTIAILSQKGGAGKTTLTVHLAVAAVQHGLRAAVFDLDQQGTALRWRDRRIAPDPAVVAAQAARLPWLLEQARQQEADMILLDSAPNADATTMAAARAADIVLVPCRPATPDLDAIGTTLSIAQIAQTPAWVVLNCVPTQGTLGIEAEQALLQAHVAVAPTHVHQRIAFVYALADGRVAQEYEPQSKAAREVYQLYAWLQDRLKE